MTITDAATEVRAALATAGATISAQKVQDIAFTLYDLAEGDDLTHLQSLLSLSLTRIWFDSAEIEAVLAGIEGHILTPMDVC
jgi:hypothetical protein